MEETVAQELQKWVSPVGKSISTDGYTLTVDAYVYDSTTQCGFITMLLTHDAPIELSPGRNGLLDSVPVNINQYGYAYLIPEKTTDTQLAFTYYFRADMQNGTNLLVSFPDFEAEAKWEEYEKNRLQVYRFLIDAAGDGMVAPAILPGSQKLGEERSSLYLEAVEGEGVLMDEYRSRKLFDRYLEPVASQFDLTFPEIRLLLYLSHLKQPVSRRELSDYTNMTRRSLSLHLQKLMAKGYIRIQESREKKTQDRRITVWMLPEAAQVEEALVNVQREYDETRYQSFSEDELLQYAYLTEKIKKNMQKVLQ